MHRLLLLAFLSFALSGGPLFSATAQPSGIADTSPQAMRALVRTAVQNDQDAGRHNHTKEMYRIRRQTPKGSQVREVVETGTMSLSRVIEVNGHPMGDAQRSQEDRRLNELINSPEEQQHKLKEERQDDENAMKIFRALPDAFIFEYQGTFPGPNGELIRMAFSPDPNWEPGSREVQVLTGMKGTMEVDRHDQRITKVDGHLFRDVDFGWGILGRLFKGGSFLIEQNKVNDHRWETTHMVLDLTGKALIFKSLVFREEELTWDFHEVPPDLTLAQGVERLRRAETELAQRDREPNSTQRQ